MDDAARKALRSLARTRSRAEMKALFKTIRKEDDAALLAVAAPPKKAKAKNADFAGAITARLSVIHGPASDKADALIGVLEGMHGPIDIASGGLTPVVRKLVRRFGERDVSCATDTLLKRLEAMGSMREKVK
jgi:hypothetical protein